VRVPFPLRRPWLLLQGARTDRDRPDLDTLQAIEDPDRFVWAMLPHAARSFAASILMLPARQARSAAVAYLYCRMLDTYEDLGEPERAPRALEAFADRMRTLEAPPPPPTRWATSRDRTHLLLIERCHLVDRVFAGLPAIERARIVELVEAMAAGMIASSRQFAAQGGVLIDGDQVSRYCHSVIGEPALYTLLLLGKGRLTVAQRADALASSELIQLANITRDIERDLARGVAYHPSLRPHLGRPDAVEPVREARRHLMAQALPQVSSFVRLAGEMTTGRFSLSRGSAVVMLLHTDRHYRWCAGKVGLAGWRGPGAGWEIMLGSAAAALSPGWARHLMRRVERDFLAAAAAL